MQEKTGRHLLVTGAGGVIGRAVAVRLAGQGERLSLLSRRTEPLEVTARAASEAGSPGVCVTTADVVDPSAVEMALDEAVDQQGPLHGVIACSGLRGPDRVGSEDRFESLISVNLAGTYHCLQATLARLSPGPDPRHLVVLSSLMGRVGAAGYVGYCASKTALLGLVRALSLEVAEAGVQVNAVCPGWVGDGGFHPEIDRIAQERGVPFEVMKRAIVRTIPQNRMVRPSEVAGMIAWLLSADARGVTGQAFDINGGMWMK